MGAAFHTLRLGPPIAYADARARFFDRTDEKFSPRVGVLYQPLPWLSVYGNFVESLGSNNSGRTAAGQPLTPQQATQYEAGLKTEWFDGRLSASMAYFHITKDNLPAADVSTQNPNDSVTIGQTRSRGIEFDVKGKLTDRLSLIGSYSYIDAKVTKDQRQGPAGIALPGNTDNVLPGAPTHSGNLWAKYAVVPDKFDIGTGVYAVGQRQGDFANTFQLPGYARLDAYAAYHWKTGASKMTAQVNVNNVLNKQYHLSTNQFDGSPRGAIAPAEPLTVLGSVRLEF